MKWEYRTQELEPRECGGYSKYVVDQISQEALYRAGDNGWELVCIYNSLAYFKRPNFKRPKEDYGEEVAIAETIGFVEEMYGEQEEEVEEAQSKEDSYEPQRKPTTGELYSRGYQRCRDN